MAIVNRPALTIGPFLSTGAPARGEPVQPLCGQRTLGRDVGRTSSGGQLLPIPPCRAEQPAPRSRATQRGSSAPTELRGRRGAGGGSTLLRSSGGGCHRGRSGVGNANHAPSLQA
jgi:hypothetical protein